MPADLPPERAAGRRAGARLRSVKGRTGGRQAMPDLPGSRGRGPAPLRRGTGGTRSDRDRTWRWKPPRFRGCPGTDSRSAGSPSAWARSERKDFHDGASGSRAPRREVSPRASPCRGRRRPATTRPSRRSPARRRSPVRSRALHRSERSSEATDAGRTIRRVRRRRGRRRPASISETRSDSGRRPSRPTPRSR